jgi:hypothetical protein
LQRAKQSQDIHTSDFHIRVKGILLESFLVEKFWWKGFLVEKFWWKVILMESFLMESFLMENQQIKTVIDIYPKTVYPKHSELVYPKKLDIGLYVDKLTSTYLFIFRIIFT